MVAEDKRLVRAIQIADSLCQDVDFISQNAALVTEQLREECQKLKSRAVELSRLLRQAKCSSHIFEPALLRVVPEAEFALDRAHSLVLRCRSQGKLLRLFNVVPAASFEGANARLNTSVRNVRWLLRLSDGEDVALPDFLASDSTLAQIWIQIVKLLRGSEEKKMDAAISLATYASNNSHWGKLIVKEGAVRPLLRLLEEGNVRSKLHAATALRMLSDNRENVESMVQAGACPIFAKSLLKEGAMNVQDKVEDVMTMQTVVIDAIVDFLDNFPSCQETFTQLPINIARILAEHLSLELLEENSRYMVRPRISSSIHSVIVTNRENYNGEENGPKQREHPIWIQSEDRVANLHPVVQTSTAVRQDTSFQDVEDKKQTMKEELKAMAAEALLKLAKGNLAFCKNITESKALLCFADLIEKGSERIRQFCSKTVVEIAQIAEHEPQLRRLLFKPTSFATKKLVNQLVNILNKQDPDPNLLIQSIDTLGCLSKIFTGSENRVINSLVRLLVQRKNLNPDIELMVIYHTLVALIKFAWKENHLHKQHSHTITKGGAVLELVDLVYFEDDHDVKLQAVALLCLLAMHVPESDEMEKFEVYNVLNHASSEKKYVVVQDKGLNNMLPEALDRLLLYQAVQEPPIC